MMFIRKMMIAVSLLGLMSSAFAQDKKMDGMKGKMHGKMAGKMHGKMGAMKGKMGVMGGKMHGKMGTMGGKTGAMKGKMAGKTKKKMPPRDPKTGRFISKEQAAKMGIKH